MNRSDINEILPDLNKARKRNKNEKKQISFNLNEELKNKYNGFKYIVQTYGCQANESDSEFIKYVLEYMGFVETNNQLEANFIMLNTCAIRETAENRIFGELGRLVGVKRKNPNLKISISGCMPQEEITVERLKKDYSFLDLIIGTHNIYKIQEYIKRIFDNNEKIIEVYSQFGDIVENLPKKRLYKHKAFVSIMNGCDEFCSYCIVPYTRGGERSREPKEIIKEVRELIKDGVLEITLIGQNVDSYGLDFKTRNYLFHDLLNDLAKENISRIRFTTSYPRDITYETCLAIKNNKNIMPQIHLPIQSGSDIVLKNMRRHYDIKIYLEKIKWLKKLIPDISITTDIIVAFPNETKNDFNKTLKICKKVKFDGAYTFIYSKREGTPAATLNDNLKNEIKKLRLNKLNKLINKLYIKGNKRFKNKIVSVLVDGVSKKEENLLYGYSEHNKVVNFKGSPELIGKIIDIKIIDTSAFSLNGIIFKK